MSGACCPGSRQWRQGPVCAHRRSCALTKIWAKAYACGIGAASTGYGNCTPMRFDLRNQAMPCRNPATAGSGMRTIPAERPLPTRKVCHVAAKPAGGPADAVDGRHGAAAVRRLPAVTPRPGTNCSAPPDEPHAHIAARWSNVSASLQPGDGSSAGRRRPRVRQPGHHLLRLLRPPRRREDLSVRPDPAPGRRRASGPRSKPVCCSASGRSTCSCTTSTTTSASSRKASFRPSWSSARRASARR